MLNLKTKEHIELQKSVFQQMYEGTRSNEGSFNCMLYKLFLVAGEDNRKSLITAFPKFFKEHDYYLEWPIIANTPTGKEASYLLGDITQAGC